MATDMAADTGMASETTGWTGSPRRRSPWGAAKRLSDRTPLRTKLITAVLALVIVALAMISFTSVYVLRSYLTTQHDTPLRAAYASIMQDPTMSFEDKSPNTLYPVAGAGFQFVYAGVQLPGDKFSPLQNGSPLYPGGNQSSQFEQPAPDVPSTTAWATANSGNPVTVSAQSGTDSWRVIVAPVTIDGTSGTLVVAYDLGYITGDIQRLITVDLFVSMVIVVVLAAVAIGVVRANLRPLNDIELTAGQIAAGHLDHRVPEGDPRTEIGSLGRSLNAMLSQIERAFHAQSEAEQTAHQSEERMRRFIADAAHELRTPLTTIRGFAAHYRLRGGAGRLRPDALGPGAGTSIVAGPGQEAASRTDEFSSPSPSRGRHVRQDRQDGSSSWSSSGPVSSASGGASPEGLSAEELDRLMGRVESEATRMGMLVEDLLTLARLDQQRPLNLAPVDLLTLAADAVQDARIVSPGRPIDLIVAPGTAFLVEGDEPRLRQVLANLVNNAITHTPAGTPMRVKIGRGTLEAGQSASSGGAGRPSGAAGAAGVDPWSDGTPTAGAHAQAVPAVVIDVEDDGPGMTAEQAQRVFERFYRADAARNRASGGTGLGLAIVAGLVSAHGGTVSVRTAPGKGADFQVKLPLSPDALVADDPDSDDDLSD